MEDFLSGVSPCNLCPAPEDTIYEQSRDDAEVYLVSLAGLRTSHLDPAYHEVLPSGATTHAKPSEPSGLKPPSPVLGGIVSMSKGCRRNRLRKCFYSRICNFLCFSLFGHRTGFTLRAYHRRYCNAVILHTRISYTFRKFFLNKEVLPNFATSPFSNAINSFCRWRWHDFVFLFEEIFFLIFIFLNTYFLSLFFIYFFHFFVKKSLLHTNANCLVALRMHFAHFRKNVISHQLISSDSKSVTRR